MDLNTWFNFNFLNPRVLIDFDIANFKESFQYCFNVIEFPKNQKLFYFYNAFYLFYFPHCCFILRW